MQTQLFDYNTNPLNYTDKENLQMATYSNLAAKLLRDAAHFFRNVGEDNASVKEQMDNNATVYDQVADLLEKNPMGEINIEEDG